MDIQTTGMHPAWTAFDLDLRYQFTTVQYRTHRLRPVTSTHFRDGLGETPVAKQTPGRSSQTYFNVVVMSSKRENVFHLASRRVKETLRVVDCGCENVSPALSVS